MSHTQQFIQKLKSAQSQLGLWVTLESPTITEIAARMKLDWVVIDTEHGHLDLKEVVDHLRALRGSETVGLVRVQEIEQGLIKRVLDLGADGIIVPQIRTAEEVEQAVFFAKYPPRGIRGIGGERATAWGKNLAFAKTGNDHTLVIPLIERVEAGRNIDSILQVPGVDAFFFGPADYSASAGYPGEWEGPGVAEEILRVKGKILAKGFGCGIMATDLANGQMRVQQGFHMIGLASDVGLLIRGITDMLHGLGRPLDPSVWK
ncbi:MAG: aldolase/citrate lyase family protein [Terriglobia bacterium]